MEFLVPRLNCGGCVRGVTRAVQAVDPAAEVVCDLQTQHVSVTTTSAPEPILASLAEVGYPGRPISGSLRRGGAGDSIRLADRAPS